MRLDVDDAEGEQFRRAAEAEDLPLTAWATRVLRREARRVLHVPEPGLSLRDLLTAFGDRYNDPGLKDAEAYRYDARFLLAHVIAFMGDVDCETVTRLDVAKLRDHLLATRSPQTCIHVLNRLRRAYAWGNEQGLVRRGDNPVEGVKRPRGFDVGAPIGSDKFYTGDEVARLLAWAEPNRRAHAIVYGFALYEGLRRGEILKLRFEKDIDWEAQLIYVRDRKGRRDLVLPINEEFRPMLGRWRNFVGAKGFVFPPETAAVPDGSSVSRVFLRACRQVGLRRIRFHDLRHTAATLLLAAGVKLEVIREILGHRTIAMTERYAHLVRDHVREAVNRVRVRGDRPGVAAVRPLRRENRQQKAG